MSKQRLITITVSGADSGKSSRLLARIAAEKGAKIMTFRIPRWVHVSRRPEVATLWNNIKFLRMHKTAP